MYHYEEQMTATIRMEYLRTARERERAASALARRRRLARSRLGHPAMLEPRPSKG